MLTAGGICSHRNRNDDLFGIVKGEADGARGPHIRGPVKASSSYFLFAGFPGVFNRPRSLENMS